AVALSPTAQTLQTGQSAVLQAAARDSGGAAVAGASFTWASSNSAAVTVDPDGTIHGIAAGSATVTATGSTGVAGTASVSVQQVPIATLAVSPQSVSLNAGGTQQLVAVARDASGNVLTGRVVTWSTSNASVANVSPLGVVFALAGGTATITATSEGKTATASVAVSGSTTTGTTGGTFAAPDLASANFDNGSVAPYIDYGGTDLSLIDDPTGAGKGKVARFHYAGTSQDRNRAVEYQHAVRWGETIFFRGQFYLPPGSAGMDDGFYQRKLIYYYPHVDYNKYGGGRGGPWFWSLITMFGAGLRWYGGYLPQTDPLVEVMTPPLAQIVTGHWYSLEQQLTMNTTPSARDGIVRIWLDGQLIYEKTDMRWTDPAWDGQVFSYNGVGSVLDWNDVYFQRFQTGEQVNYMNGSFDEYRYWDNVAFSTRRIGP
ncbi:MAG TPA: Ig-like domain-containing protein, partial [Longimicrobiaceae bacterium]